MTLTPQLKSSTAIQSLTTIAMALPGIQAAHAETQIVSPKTSFQYIFYDEGKKRYRIDVYQALLEMALGSKSDLRIAATRDVQAGASVAFYSPESRTTRNPADFSVYEPSVSSASIQEDRYAVDATARYFAEDFTIGLTGNISEEHDYGSQGGAIKLVKDFNMKNTTLTLGYGFLNNCYKPVVQASAFFTPRRTKGRNTAQVIGLTVEQILTDKNYIEQIFDYTYDQGYLGDPYKLAYVYGNPVPLYGNQGVYVPAAFGGHIPGDPDPNNGLGLVMDTRPKHRGSFAAKTRFVQYIPCFESSLHLSYRFVHNSWGINSHTVTADYYQPFWEDYEAYFGMRYYTQNNAKFYYIGFNYIISTPLLDTKPLGRHASSDNRLSKFGSITYQGTLSMKFLKNKNGKLSLSAGIIDTRNRYYAGHQNKTPNPTNNFNTYFVGLQVVFDM